MLIAFNKPYGVVCQFSPCGDKRTLKQFIDVPGVYPAGRLDTDSEGLLLLTDDGRLQARITTPRNHVNKVYWAEVEGEVAAEHLDRLKSPLDLGILLPNRRHPRGSSVLPQSGRELPPFGFGQRSQPLGSNSPLPRGKTAKLDA
jgi:23S rRNA pseudouridine2457 synthase